MPKCTYIIPCWQNAKLSKKAIETALAQPDSAVIAIDNASDDNGETEAMMKELREKYKENKNVLLIDGKENLGWIGGVNECLKFVPDESEYVCFMNNDVELPDDFWKKIEPHFDEDVGAVGPIGNSVAGQHDYKITGYPDHHEVKFLIGFCMVIKKEVLDQTGGLDPIFGWGLSDDLDLSLRIRKLNYRLFIARDCRIYHHGSKSIAIKFKDNKEYEADLADKQQIFINKWSKPEYDDIMRVDPHVSGTIGIPHLEMMHAEFVHAFHKLNRPPGCRAAFVKGSLVMKARNDIVESMQGDWLLFIDSDMTFPQDALTKLLAHDLDIVGGLCFKRVPPFNPTIYSKRPSEDKWDWAHQYPRDALFEVDGTGCAFLLIKKKVFDKMPKPWFEYKGNVSEDLSFCKKAKELGFKVWIDSSVKIGHLATMPVDEAYYDDYMKDKQIVKA